MPISDATKEILGEAVWAGSAQGERAEPADLGIDEAVGWGVAYEQPGTGKFPERVVFNELTYRATSAIRDIFATGVPAWDAAVDYRPDLVEARAACFATTPTGLWVTVINTGPSFGNATDPELSGQAVWRRY